MSTPLRILTIISGPWRQTAVMATRNCAIRPGARPASAPHKKKVEFILPATKLSALTSPAPSSTSDSPSSSSLSALSPPPKLQMEKDSAEQAVGVTSQMLEGKSINKKDRQGKHASHHDPKSTRSLVRDQESGTGAKISGEKNDRVSQVDGPHHIGGSGSGAQNACGTAEDRAKTSSLRWTADIRRLLLSPWTMRAGSSAKGVGTSNSAWGTMSRGLRRPATAGAARKQNVAGCEEANWWGRPKASTRDAELSTQRQQEQQPLKIKRPQTAPARDHATWTGHSTTHQVLAKNELSPQTTHNRPNSAAGVGVGAGNRTSDTIRDTISRGPSRPATAGAARGRDGAGCGHHTGWGRPEASTGDFLPSSLPSQARPATAPLKPEARLQARVVCQQPEPKERIQHRRPATAPGLQTRGGALKSSDNKHHSKPEHTFCASGGGGGGGGEGGCDCGDVSAVRVPHCSGRPSTAPLVRGTGGAIVVGRNQGEGRVESLVIPLRWQHTPDGWQVETPFCKRDDNYLHLGYQIKIHVIMF